MVDSNPTKVQVTFSDGSVVEFEVDSDTFMMTAEQTSEIVPDPDDPDESVPVKGPGRYMTIAGFVPDQ
jgi:hypothetical protein